MKVKKFIGKSVNGFTILDVYAVELPSGCKTRRVRVKCDDCGREFERNSGVDFEHIKCKCKTKNGGRIPQEKKYVWIFYEGKKYTQSDFCRMHGIKLETFRTRIKSGMTPGEAIQKEFNLICSVCGAPFIGSNPRNKFCSEYCRHRASKHKKQLRNLSFCSCEVCNNIFTSYEPKRARCCSEHCRRALARLERKGRYKHLYNTGGYDASVTLENVYNKFDGVCCGCGKHLDFDCSVVADDYPSIDHITPISRGGTHTWNNVQLLCRLCNAKKGAKIMA